MAIQLKGLVCVVTGADEGVGRGIVLGFLERGAHVVAGMLNAEKSAIPEPALSVQMDVTKPDQIAAAVEATIAKFGRIDVWINNAGIYPRFAADKLTYADFRRVNDINLDGTWRCCEAAIPHLKKNGGVIINVGSITVRRGAPELSHYMASKGGIIGLTRGLARDLGKFGIRVNCVHLGAVQTEGELRLFPDQAALLKNIEAVQALPGRLTPKTIEPVFAFLASSDSSDVTGQCLTVDRGWVHD